VPVEGSEFQIEADSLILAIGQQPDIAYLDGTGVKFRSDGAIITDPASRMTDTEQVYAGGDVTRGPAIIIQACEDGRRAAMAICQEFGIDFALLPARPAELSGEDVLRAKGARTRKVLQHEPDLLPVVQRAGWDLVEQTLDETAARAEAARCLQCSALCDKCVEVCPNRANYTYHVEPVRWTLPVLACRDGTLAVVGEEAFTVTQARQIVHVDDLCNECGNCATFCVHQGKPYADKPRLFLNEADFLHEDDNAFFIMGNTVRRREGGQEASLTLGKGTFVFENDQVRASLSGDWKIEELELKDAFDGTRSLEEAAEMAVVLKGLADSLPFLLTAGESLR